jgi:GDPmannose 4,6-dehydratase
MAECCARRGIKLVQCSSSEIFPNSPGILINESMDRNPNSAYAIAKHEADEFMEGLRRSGHQMYNAILFSHESERRKPIFLVRKISMGVSRIYSGEKDLKIGLGDPTSRRDWSPARHFTDWIYAMSKYDPDDYILASGISHSVEDVLQIAFREIGIEDWQSYVIINQDLGRPSDRNHVIGDPSKIEQRTGILRNEDFEGLIRSIIQHDKNGGS